MLSSLRKVFKTDIHTLEVIRKSSASVLVKVGGMGAGLVVSIFLGRILGPSGLGIISLSNQFVNLLLVLSMFGMENVLIKYLAIASDRGDWQRVANSVYTAVLFNGALALIISATGVLLAPFLANDLFKEPELEVPLLIALMMVVPQTFSRILASALNGFRKIWQSSLVNEALSTWIVGIGLILFLILDVPITVVSVALLYAAGRLVVTTAIFTYWKRLFRFRGKRRPIAAPMLRMATPLAVVSATYVISSNADVVMLGWLSNSYEVGIYSVAARLALLVSFFQVVTNAAISPKLAALYAAGKKDELNKMVRRVTGMLIVIATVFLVVFIFGGSHILGLWGQEFRQAHLTLIILGIGQFFNISSGCSGGLLIMCGYEKAHGYISMVFVVINLILNYFLISRFGAEGAAVATAVAVSGVNIVKMIVAANKTGVLTNPLFKNKR
ncbi:MAG: flippase [Prolixibacteraceae bacterium]